MRLFEAILQANHRALEGDPQAGLRPADFQSSLPVAALTCIDVRLNPLLPDVMGLPKEEFIWLRNAGNIIFDPMSSMMRTLALACAVKGGREIAIIGHTDCKVAKTSMLQLTDAFKRLGIERSRLPNDLVEFFGLFSSERQNVLRGVDFVRQSPLIGPAVPVHGLLVDIETGRLEWLVNGYEVLERTVHAVQEAPSSAASPLSGFVPNWNQPEIGNALGTIEQERPAAVPAPPPPKPPPVPPRLPGKIAEKLAVFPSRPVKVVRPDGR